MELKDFISVAGKSGLHTIVGKSKNNVIVESLKDKKRFPIFNTNKISGLSDISIYTYDEEILLSELFDRIQKKYKKEAAISHLESAEELKKKGSNDTAAIASSLAAETYKLKILKENRLIHLEIH